MKKVTPLFITPVLFLAACGGSSNSASPTVSTSSSVSSSTTAQKPVQTPKPTPSTSQSHKVSRSQDRQALSTVKPSVTKAPVIRKKAEVAEVKPSASTRAIVKPKPVAQASSKPVYTPKPTTHTSGVVAQPKVTQRSLQTSSTGGDDSRWDRIAQCESGGNWSTRTGNGFEGGLQFDPGTWNSYGGGKYSSSAAGASREQQIEIAKKVQASQGWGAWPVCSAR